MDRRSLLLFVVPVLALAAVHGCVGDSAITAGADGGQDASVAEGGNTTDGQSPQADAGADAAMVTDGGADSGPQCIYVTDAGGGGTLDQSFANVTHTEAVSVVSGDVDSAGNTFVVGAPTNCLSASSDYDFAVYKYGPTGAADNSFGTAGRACAGVANTASVGSERPYGLRVDPAGNIVVVGTTGNGGFNPVQIVVARFKPTGQLDATFATNGVYSVAVAGTTFPTAYTVAFDTSVSPPKLLVVGADGDPFKANTAAFVLRLTATGQADNGFNGGAPIVDTNATGYYGVTADGAGNVFTTGSAKPNRDLIVSKWTPGGTAAVFGTSGKATLSSVSTATGGGMAFSEGRDVHVLSDGKLIIAGLQEAEQGPVFVAKLTAAGALDTSFAATSAIKGVLMLPNVILNTDYEFSIMRTRCDGKLLVTGSVGVGQSYAVAARVIGTGALDAFGDAGMAVSSVVGLGVGVGEDPTSGRILLMARNGLGQLQLERYQP